MIGELGDRVAALVQHNLLEIPDFPEPGVLFRDITELFANGPAFKELEIGRASCRERVEFRAGGGTVKNREGAGIIYPT